MTKVPQPDFDVIICGGGLAGLTLALQLKLNLDDIKICVLEQQKSPLPVAKHKVGESSVEGGAYYLMQTLQLESYVLEEHVEKLGLRFFGQRDPNFAERFERGISKFEPGVPSYQFDRGLLEAHLRELVVQANIILKEGVRVTDIKIQTKGINIVQCTDMVGIMQTHTANWVTDSSGRRQLLQRKMELQIPSPHNASASWWRVKGECDVSALVPKSDTQWHQRIEVKRWHSTNHIMGKGYWIWFIPLSSGHTSIGIVSDESLHPIANRRTYIKSMAWLKQHEPEIASFVDNYKHVDHKFIKGFAHLSKQVFSKNGWSCVGEAGVFTDPLYSIGLDLIAIANTSTTALIKLHRDGVLNTDQSDLYNSVFLEVVSMVTQFYSGMYPMFDNDQVFLAKLTWDYMIYWGYIAPLTVHEVFGNPSALVAYAAVSSQIRQINLDCQRLLKAWSSTESKKLARGLYTKSSAPIQEPMRLSLDEPKTAQAYIYEANKNLVKMRNHVRILYKKANKQMEFSAKDQAFFETYGSTPNLESATTDHDLLTYLDDYFVATGM